jgi:4-amino-4-deoxy-L-arabinose transferase-like glycosyltransferase
MSKTTQRMMLILALAAAMQIGYGIGLWANGRAAYSQIGDGPSYVQTAMNFWQRGIWSADPTANPLPDNFRMPIYPLVLLFFLATRIPLDWLMVLQSASVVLAACLTYFYGRRLFSERVAFIAALILALDPFLASKYVARAVMTEAFALPLLLVGLCSMALFFRDRTRKRLFHAAIFIVAGAYLKPQFVSVVPFLLLTGLLAGRAAWKNAVLAFSLAIVLLSPWLYYNFAVLKVFQFSSIPPVTLFDTAYRFKFWLTKGQDPYFQSTMIGPGLAILGVENSNQFFEPHRAEILEDVGKKWIMEAPFSFVFYHIIHIPRVFYHDTTLETLREDFGWFSSLENGDDTGTLKDVIFGRFAKAASETRQHPAILLALLLKVLMLAVSLLALGNYVLRRILAKEHSQISLLLCAFLLMYGVMVSPLGLHRYRIPIEPLLLLLAGDSALLLYSAWQSKRLKKIAV